MASARNQDFARAFGSAGRALGKAPLSLDKSESDALAGAGIDWPLDTWGADELGRVILLLDAPPDMVTRTFFRGDNRERQAVLRALPLLSTPETFLPTAVEACRTNVADVFEAIASENPYPARHFTDLAFSQMILKAIFLGVRVERTIGLAKRITPDLGRMTADYAAERRAAGRPVPEDCDVIARLVRGTP